MGHLPDIMRPKGLPHRDFTPGLDLPRWFHDEIKGLDQKLFFVWHPFKTLYDDVMNTYEGELENPRYVIGEFQSQEVWGYPLMQPKEDAPLPDNRWHIWRLCDPYGWCHVAAIEAPDEEYLALLLRRLHLQAKLQDRGRRAYRDHLESEQEKEMEKNLTARRELFDHMMTVENKWLLDRAAANYARGVVEATKPQKETVMSYPGQKNRSKIVRDLDDREGGLILPEDIGA